MNPRFQYLLTTALRLGVAAACCAGIWYSWRIAHADALFRHHTKASIRAAISLVPDDSKYYLHLAQFSGENSQALLNHTLRLNRFHAQADIELGLQYEAAGNYAAAERSLLNAYSVDHSYLPRWTLANYYLRRGNWPAFWKWARSAASMPSGDIGSLFALCWRVSPDANQITAQIITAQIANNKPSFLRSYIGFLISKQQEAAAATMARKLVHYGSAASDRSTLLSTINGLANDGDAGPAVSLWHLLIQQHWIVADTTLPNNAEFSRDPLPVVFDWRIPQSSGLYSVTGTTGLETVFSGSEPEQCTLANQMLALSPGAYTLQYNYQTTGIPPGSGLRWEILNPVSKMVIGQSPSLSSEAGKQASFPFTVPDSAPLIDLRLVYQRSPGTSRISGTLDLQSTHLQAQPSP